MLENLKANKASVQIQFIQSYQVISCNIQMLTVLLSWQVVNY